MYKPSKVIMTLFALALFLGACLPAAQQPVQPVQNTPELIDVQAQISTSVAQTMAAQNQIGTFVAQTVAAQASPTPTATPFTIPTLTPFVIPSSTPWAGGGGGGGGGGSSGGSGGPTNSGAYDCEITDQRPRDGAEIYRPGQGFDVVWSIKNVGTKTLPADTFFTYIGGTSMSPTKGFMIGKAVAPKESFTVRIEVIAPQVSSLDMEQFTMQWAVVYFGTKLCRPYISIFVQRR